MTQRRKSQYQSIFLLADMMMTYKKKIKTTCQLQSTRSTESHLQSVCKHPAAENIAVHSAKNIGHAGWLPKGTKMPWQHINPSICHQSSIAAGWAGSQVTRSHNIHWLLRSFWFNPALVSLPSAEVLRCSRKIRQTGESSIQICYGESESRSARWSEIVLTRHLQFNETYLRPYAS